MSVLVLLLLSVVPGFVVDLSSEGTGVLVDKNYVVTCENVTKGRKLVNCRFKDGRSVLATVVYTDHDKDISIVRLWEPSTFEPVVIKSGFPKSYDFGFAFSFSGMNNRRYGVHMLRRANTTRKPNGKTDFKYDEAGNCLILAATIYPGGSGGPIVTDDLKLIGVTQACSFDTNTVIATSTKDILEALEKVSTE